MLMAPETSLSATKMVKTKDKTGALVHYIFNNAETSTTTNHIVHRCNLATLSV